MENNLHERVKELNVMVSNGQLVAAAEKFFAPEVRTVEYDGSVTEGKPAMIKKLADFVATIKAVNKIELLRSAVGENASYSEYILDLNMQDGSNFYLHEIIRVLWKDDKIIEERYFKG